MSADSLKGARGSLFGTRSRAAAYFTRAARLRVSPEYRGLRMISEILRPTAVSFIDLMLRDRERNLRVEAMRIAAGSPLAGETVGELRGRGIGELLILALSEGDEPWAFAPPDDRRLEAGTSVVYMAGPEARDELERLASASG